MKKPLFISQLSLAAPAALAQLQAPTDGDAVRLNEVSASATRTERPRDDVPGTATVIATDEAERKQARNRVHPLKRVTDLRCDAPGKRWGGQLLGTAVERKHGIDATIDATAAPVTLTSPGFAVPDLLGHWKPSEQATIDFGVFNLTDRKYFLWPDLQRTGGGTAAMAASANLDRFSQPGRNARVAFKYQS